MFFEFRAVNSVCVAKSSSRIFLAKDMGMKQAIESYTIDPVTFISKTKQAGKKGCLFRCSLFLCITRKRTSCLLKVCFFFNYSMTFSNFILYMHVRKHIVYCMFGSRRTTCGIDFFLPLPGT